MEQGILRPPDYVLRLHKQENGNIVVRESWEVEGAGENPTAVVCTLRPGDSSWRAQIQLSGAFHYLSEWHYAPPSLP